MEGVDSDLCDVCYWRKRAERTPLEADLVRKVSKSASKQYMNKAYAFEAGAVWAEAKLGTDIAHAIGQAEGKDQ